MHFTIHFCIKTKEAFKKTVKNIKINKIVLIGMSHRQQNSLYFIIN